MDNNKQGGWNSFRGIGFDKRAVLRRIKKAELASTRHARRFLLGRLENAKLVRKEISLWAILVGLIIAGMGVQLGMSQQGYMTTAPKSGGTYAEAMLGPLTSLNPLYASSSAETSLGRLVFSSLYNYDSTGRLHQDLATKLSVGDGGKTYTLSIRKDAKWHDGEPLTAKDIAFTVNLIKNPASRAAALRMNWVDVTVRAVDDYTVEFKLPAISAAFPHALTFPVLPVHILANVNAGALRESPFSQAPVGSGPFEFKLLQRADAITNHEVVHLVANEKYYGGRPKLDQFEIYAYSNQADIRTALKGNEINGAVDVSNVTADDIKGNYAVAAAPLDTGVYAIFNNLNPILSNQKVRKALQVGTDYAKVRQVAGGQVQPLSLPFIDNQIWGDVPKLPALNTAQAAVMLDDAGWKLNGAVRYKDSTPLALTITTTKDPQYIAAAGELKQQWESLGVKANVLTVDATSVSAGFVQNVLQARNFDVLVYQLLIGADPDVYAYWYSSQIGQSGFNFANYSNKNADAALASARSRSEPELRNAKYVAFARQWLEDAPSLALYRPVVEYVSNKNDSAVMPNTQLVSMTDRYSNILYWSVGTESVYKTP